MSDFTWVPDFPIIPTKEYRTIASEFENGERQYRQKWPTPLRTWKLSFKSRTLSEAQEVEAFHALKSGRATSFTWTNPFDNVEYTVRFEKDDFSYNISGYNQTDFEITFIED